MSAKNGTEPQSQIPVNDENHQDVDDSKPNPDNSETIETNHNDLPLSDEIESEPDIKIALTPGNFEFSIIDDAEDTTEVIANKDFHAFFIKDRNSSKYLEDFSRGTKGIHPGDMPRKGPKTPLRDTSRIPMPLVERLRSKSPETRVIYTTKQSPANDLLIRARRFINKLCDRLKLSPHDKEVISGAGDIHVLAKIGHSHRPTGNIKTSADASVNLLQFLKENPPIIKIIRMMYRSLKKDHPDQTSLELVGANILTLVDLYCGTVHEDSHLTEDILVVISRELKKLSGKLFLDNVVEAFISILEIESQALESDENRFRIIVYSNRSSNLYPLQTRLRNEGIKAVMTESLASLAGQCRRKPPDMLIMRINSTPNDVVKALQFLSTNGIDINVTPTFLLVKSSIIKRLASLHKLGIEDIFDLGIDLDVLILKIKKYQTSSGVMPGTNRGSANQQSGSRGNLCEMNIIDLLQALGPSRRTTRITVKTENPASDPLMMYLDQGAIIFAKLGEMEGETAIHKALKWENGTWFIEQIGQEDLPEPNNELPNEAILMEGCRLMDEKAKKPGVS